MNMWVLCFLFVCLLVVVVVVFSPNLMYNSVAFAASKLKWATSGLDITLILRYLNSKQTL